MDEQIENGQKVIRETTGMFTGFWNKLVNYLPTIGIALIFFLIGIVLARLLTKLMSRTMRRSKIDATASGFGQSFVRILLYVILIIICLSILGVPTASIITVVGAAGVTIGLALQNALSNLAGGFVILFAKPFQAGDYIRVGSEAGVVESVTILYTQLRTLDNQSVFLPNSIVSSGSVSNLSQRGRLRVCVPVSVSYSTDLALARDVLIRSVTGQPGILDDPAPFVNIKELSDSGIVMLLYAWVPSERYFAAESQMLECAKNALDAAGIEIPFPQIDVHSK